MDLVNRPALSMSYRWRSSAFVRSVRLHLSCLGSRRAALSSP